MKLVVVGVLLGVIACANPNLGPAKRARYDLDPALVHQAALEVAVEKYAHVESSSGLLSIKTAWHQVSDGSVDESGAHPHTGHPPVRVPAPRRQVLQRLLFARFEIKIVGARPCVVDVRGYASEWRPGQARRIMLEGDSRPGWIDERTDGLRAAIYQRLKRYAVLSPEPVAAAR